MDDSIFDKHADEQADLYNKQEADKKAAREKRQQKDQNQF